MEDCPPTRCSETRATTISEPSSPDVHHSGIYPRTEEAMDGRREREEGTASIATNICRGEKQWDPVSSDAALNLITV